MCTHLPEEIAAVSISNLLEECRFSGKGCPDFGRLDGRFVGE